LENCIGARYLIYGLIWEGEYFYLTGKTLAIFGGLS
jgi:hypothetical protein